MNARLESVRFDFKSPARTSRGIYLYKTHFFLVVENQGGLYMGETAPMHDLSVESEEQAKSELLEIIQYISQEHRLPDSKPYCSSVRFALESIAMRMQDQDCSFSIPINGLVWMSDVERMWEDTLSKVVQGFTTIKYKVGANALKDELDLLRRVRESFPNLCIRLDANGAFDASTCLSVLNDYASFDIHSIEQPIAAGQWEELSHVIASSPIPIALDEELIGISSHQMNELLEKVHPPFIVLKPMLHGGFSHCDQWIKLAESHGIRWWATSYLESNVGLHALGQWLQKYHIQQPQGLGTGGIYTSNIEAAMNVQSGHLVYDSSQNWNYPWESK
ncbi:MAG: o-succinylbenzoate synthase [Flavobacteriales bacterium]